MIRVNLLRALGNTAAANAAVHTAGAANAAAAEAKRQAVLKVLVLLLFPGLLMMVERITLDSKKADVLKAKNELAQIGSEIDGFGNVSSRVTEFNEKKKKVSKSLEILQAIARLRLREVKSLDTLQTMMPPTVWLRRLSIENDMVSMNGYAKTDEGIPQLISTLEKSVFFSNVESKGTSVENNPSGMVRTFEVGFRIGIKQ